MSALVWQLCLVFFLLGLAIGVPAGVIVGGMLATGRVGDGHQEVPDAG